MDGSMKNILEMHSKISNDPWAYTRKVRDDQEHELKDCINQHQKMENLSWYSKSNSNAQMERFQWMQRKECEMLKNMQDQETEIKILKNNERLENLMGKFMEKEKNDSLHRDRYSQYLRENDPELRQLATQLREAYVNKIRLAQIDEKERLKNELVAADIPYVRAMEKQLKDDEEQEKLDQFLEEEKKYNFRKQLEKQMKDKERYDQLNDPREEDKQRIEAIIKDNLEKIQEEKERDFQKKMMLRKSYMDTFKEREEELLREKERNLAEEAKFKLYRKEKEYTNEEQLLKKKLREENLNLIQARLGELLAQKQRDIDEFEAARQDVAIAQAEMQAFRHEKTERDNKEKAKRKYISELNEFQKFAKDADLARIKEERKLDQEIEELNRQKDEEIRQKNLEKLELKEIFKNECQANIKDKLLEKERCHEIELENEKSFKDDNDKYKNDVQRERIAMLKEMAKHLYPGCIPRGMLKENDIEYLEDPLKNFLLTKKSYPDEELN